MLWSKRYSDVIMSAMASQITGVSIVCLTVVFAGADQIKHQSPASLAFVRGIHRWPVDSPHKGPETRKMFPLDDVILDIVFISMDLYKAVAYQTLETQVINMSYFKTEIQIDAH